MVSHIVFIIVVWILISCEQPFSYSPFEVRVPEELQNTTAKNLEKIRLIENDYDSTFKIALISDTHYHFNNLRDAIQKINQDEAVAFIMVAGDITENGLQEEFEIFHQIMAQSRKPYVTVIGNHDHLSNGRMVYQQVFGPLNYTFNFKGIRFVMWNNTRWESNAVPDWKWFRENIRSSEASNARASGTIIPFSHIPPYDSQIKDSLHTYNKILRSNNINLSIHGHKHSYSTQTIGSNIKCITIGTPQHRSYAELIVSPDALDVQKVNY